jgi:type II secretory ATPase GspE/PulE/Tfp pilus assembly ATPase PilB-like protein
MSIEDPVERLLDGVNQAAVDTRTGISFSDGLRAVLRQDPDILMIGEIRDEETASIGIRASLTGILVLSTVHASDAASVVGTLFNYGIPGYTLATALKGIMSQRLLRRICSKCRVSYRPDAKILRALGLDPDEHAGTILHRGRGCVECFNTGYRGRVGIYEVLPVTDLIPDLILRQTTSEVIRQVARDEGMKTLRQSAMAKVLEGATTVEEMYRVSF